MSQVPPPPPKGKGVKKTEAPVDQGAEINTGSADIKPMQLKVRADILKSYKQDCIAEDKKLNEMFVHIYQFWKQHKGAFEHASMPESSKKK